MPKSETHRVLGRKGARELTPQEVEQIDRGRRGEAALHTDSITFNPLTGAIDGDG
jgi:hypothetical protein